MRIIFGGFFEEKHLKKFSRLQHEFRTYFEMREKYLLLRIVEVTSITCINELLNSVDFTQGDIFVQEGPLIQAVTNVDN